MNKSRTSGSYGITLDKRSMYWTAYINLNGCKVRIGSSKIKEVAARMYDEYVKANSLNKRLNFPDPEPDNLIPNTRLIRLNKGMFAIVDECDYEYLNQFNWSAHRYRNIWYADRCSWDNSLKKRVTIKMHRLIMGFPDKFIDHKNNNGLHNYRANMRVCDNQQNCMNGRSRANTSSKFKGVYRSNNKGNFHASICINAKIIHLGTFVSKTDAARAYDAKAKELHGEFACLNFPNE